MTAAVAALLADGQTAIRDVYNWRVKETERMKVGGCLRSEGVCCVWLRVEVMFTTGVWQSLSA
jgi:5-enolpyruvylshikimate-3-phosphate synthase